MAQKRKISVTLDEELVAALEGGDETLSGQVNEAVRVEVARRARHRLLQDWLDQLDASDGPVDEALVGRFEELLR
ncbi:MAG: type II toxin-antitoxin system CcdA family antitoxin [Actinomycetota bacterium]|nr:type II toxin-antitoxin system CcdA family antitoxin [Actinomycetota bacterium]